MKRLAALLVAAVLAVTGLTYAPNPPAAEADYVSPTTSKAICQIGRWAYLGDSWELMFSRTIHFGTAHVTQCWYGSVFNPAQTCLQYVWGPGVANPYWDRYPAPCWAL